MSVHFGDLAAQVRANGTIDAGEILALRKAGWSDGVISQAEAEVLFSINDGVSSRDGEWSDFFVEALREYVINGTNPKGQVSQDEADWLVLQINKDGRLCSMTELELLVRIFERAENVPDLLKSFVLTQVEHAVLKGTGPTRDGGELSDTHINQSEAQILRRVIFSHAGDSPAAVSRNEAETLFRLKDATVDAANPPEWKAVFVQGVGNYLMGFASTNAQISRERALELEAFMDDNRANIGNFVGRMAKVAPNAFGKVFGQKSLAPSRSSAAVSAQEITGNERGWLDAQIARNNQIDEYDQALLDFIAEEVGEG